jgi:hypothetical protein
VSRCQERRRHKPSRLGRLPNSRFGGEVTKPLGVVTRLQKASKRGHMTAQGVHRHAPEQHLGRRSRHLLPPETGRTVRFYYGGMTGALSEVVSRDKAPISLVLETGYLALLRDAI